MWIPEACTLPTAERPLRVAEFDELFASLTRPPERPERTRLRLHLPVAAAGTARALAARETECCAFFAFDVREAADGAVLDVRVPVVRTDVLDAVQRRADAVRTDAG
jgi:hypothetical protein